MHPVGEVREAAIEGEAPSFVQRHQPSQEQPAEQLAEDAHRQQERRPCRHPATTVGRKPAAWDNHVDVRMVSHCRTPGVEHRGNADARTQMLRVGGDGRHRL